MARFLVLDAGTKFVVHVSQSHDRQSQCLAVSRSSITTPRHPVPHRQRQNSLIDAVFGLVLARTIQHQIKVPDLLIAAIAQRHQLTVLHYDKDYDKISATTGQATQWIAPAGTF